MKAIAPRLQRASDPESTIEQDPQLVDDGHFIIDEKQRSVDLTELGHEFVEEILIEEKLLDEGDSLYSTAI